MHDVTRLASRRPAGSRRGPQAQGALTKITHNGPSLPAAHPVVYLQRSVCKRSALYPHGSDQKSIKFKRARRGKNGTDEIAYAACVLASFTYKYPSFEISILLNLA
jgi:hypothetical protein